MAGGTCDLMTLIGTTEEFGEFRPYAYYGPEEDALKVYISDAPDYARRLNSRVTVYLSLDDDELVGCQIKGVKYAIEDVGSFDVQIDHQGVCLKLLIVAMHDAFTKYGSPEESRKIFRSLVSKVSELDMSLDLDKTCSA